LIDRLMAIEMPLGMEAGGRGGLAAFVAATAQPLLTTNASSHLAYSVFPFTQCARPPPASMMLAPVFLHGWDGSAGPARVAMVLEVGDKDDGGSYNRDDVTLLSSLGRSLSSVLEHAESNERAASQASHLLSSSGARNCPP
jgi:GAF domain-containing protein